MFPRGMSLTADSSVYNYVRYLASCSVRVSVVGSRQTGVCWFVCVLNYKTKQKQGQKACHLFLFITFLLLQLMRWHMTKMISCGKNMMSCILLFTMALIFLFFLSYFYTIMHFSLFTRTCTPSCIFLVYYDLYTVMHFPCLLGPIHCHAFSLFIMTNTLSCIFLVYCCTLSFIFHVYYDLYTVVHFPCLL